jgi:hypothetical protein
MMNFVRATQKIATITNDDVNSTRSESPSDDPLLPGGKWNEKST